MGMRGASGDLEAGCARQPEVGGAATCAERLRIARGMRAVQTIVTRCVSRRKESLSTTYLDLLMLNLRGQRRQSTA